MTFDELEAIVAGQNAEPAKERVLAASLWQRADRVMWPTGGDRWSSVHRVFEVGFTFCSRRVPLGAVRPIENTRLKIGECSRCARMLANSEKNKLRSDW